MAVGVAVSAGVGLAPAVGVSAANVAFDDHPNEQRFADRIDTVTVDSVFAWLERSRLAGRVQVMR